MNGLEVKDFDCNITEKRGERKKERKRDRDAKCKTFLIF